MKVLTITTALVLGFAAQAIAGTTAEATPKFNPGVTPKAAQAYVPRYDIETDKVAQSVKFENPALAKGLNAEPALPSKALVPSR